MNIQKHALILVVLVTLTSGQVVAQPGETQRLNTSGASSNSADLNLYCASSKAPKTTSNKKAVMIKNKSYYRNSKGDSASTKMGNRLDAQ